MRKAVGSGRLRQRMAGGRAPSRPRSKPVKIPVMATPGPTSKVKAPIEKGIVLPSNKVTAMMEATSAPVRQARVLS